MRSRLQNHSSRQPAQMRALGSKRANTQAQARMPQKDSMFWNFELLGQSKTLTPPQFRDFDFSLKVPGLAALKKDCLSEIHTFRGKETDIRGLFSFFRV